MSSHFVEAVKAYHVQKARKLELLESTRRLVAELLTEGVDQETIEKLVRDQVRKFNS